MQREIAESGREGRSWVTRVPRPGPGAAVQLTLLWRFWFSRLGPRPEIPGKIWKSEVRSGPGERIGSRLLGLEHEHSSGAHLTAYSGGRSSWPRHTCTSQILTGRCRSYPKPFVSIPRSRHCGNSVHTWAWGATVSYMFSAININGDIVRRKEN